MPRPRETTDAELLAATASVISRCGPSRVTLAAIAAEVGVVPATLVQRFGSKARLLSTLAELGVADGEARLRAAAESSTPPLRRLRAVVLAALAPIDDPETAYRHIAQFGADLTDGPTREIVQRWHAHVETTLAHQVRAAAAELPSAPSPAIAARILAALITGSTVEWSLRPHGELRRRVSRDLDTVLDGWRRSAAAGSEIEEA